MPRKNDLNHTHSKKRFSWKSLEHCLKIRDWDQWPNWSYIETRKLPKSWEFLSLVNFCGARFYGIFNDLSIPEIMFNLEKGFVENIFWNIVSDLRKDFWKNILKDYVFNLYLLFELKKNFEATWFWKRKFTWLGKIGLKKNSNRVHKENFKRFYFFGSFLFLLKLGLLKII